MSTNEIGRHHPHAPVAGTQGGTAGRSHNARSNVHTPRSTVAAWSGRGGAALAPLFDVHREFVLGAQVLHADETPVDMLVPGAGKTRLAYVWAYARGGFDAQPGVAFLHKRRTSASAGVNT